jgi:hypothetical protein
MSEVNLQDALDALKGVQSENVYPVYIPSLKKNVMFKEMTTKQEKAIVKTIIDSPVYNSEFIFAIRDIIKENCAEELDIDSLTIIDKTAICLTMRLKSIGPTFDYTFKVVNKTKTIDIAEYIEKFKKVKVPEDKTVGSDSVQIVCGYPTVKDEYELENEFRANVKDVEISTVDEARKAIGDVFSNELVKYIKGVSIKGTDLDMSTFDFKSRIAILDEIGNSATGEVLEYIEESNKAVREALTIELELNDEDKKKFKTEKLTSILEAGSDFFIIS